MALWRKLRTRFGRSMESDLAEEMRLHRAMIEEEFCREGLSSAEAHHRAAREFGPMALAMETSLAEWSFAWVESLVADTRYALRALMRDKTFGATAVLTLGAGLALASAAFTLFNAYVLRPFSVAGPDSLFEVHWLGKDRYIRMHPWTDYQDIRARRDVFAEAAASRGVFVSSPSRQWSGKLVSGNYFRMLGARIAIGRAIEERDDTMPGEVAVLSHGVWKSTFRSDPAILGQKLSLRGHTYVVIGVAAPEFAGLDESPPDFWVPYGTHAAFRSEPMDVEVTGRLRDGITRPQAEAALQSLATRDRPDMRVELTSRATAVSFSPMVLYFFAPVLAALGLILATCCANVANMLLARGLSRQREIGIRLSIGASRGRLVRQLLTEALAIAVLAGFTGLLLARIAIDAGQRLFFATAAPEFAKLVRLHSLEPDYRVFLFALGAATVCAVGAALLPALQATRPNTIAALRNEVGRGIRSSHLRDALVVTQVVVCAVLLVCGALLYRRAAVFQARDTGLREHGILNITPTNRPAGFLEALRQSPDIQSLAVASRAPWFGNLNQTPVLPSGHTSSRIAGYNRVSAAYFQIFGIGLKSGRWFTASEAQAGAPVAVISEATARAFWPGEDPLGKTIHAVESHERYVDTLRMSGDLRVVGVAADVIHGWVFKGPDRSCIYVPAAENDPSQAGEILALFRADENTAVQRLRQWIGERWPALDCEVLPLSTVLSVQIYPFQAAAWIGWILGILAGALSVSGMYGVMLFLVNQRSKEIGIRVALGATPADITRMVLGRSAQLAGLGALIGATAAGGAIKLLVWWSAGLGVLAWDNLALGAGVALAAAVAISAAVGPSHRAARVDPNVVLRSD